ncbi:HNH endonuclease [Rummeliibacillus pycnus]|uniref:HNH endonuclease n=1 Tax=Rummeliibacillus pycnus TaxID=101070 RepID=UPI0037C76BAA
MNDKMVVVGKSDCHFFFSGASFKGTGSPRHEPGAATERNNFRNSLGTQKKLMYQNGDIGIIPQEVRDKLAGREFRSFNEFRVELWKEIGNSNFAKGFNNANRSLMNQGFAPRAPKNGHYRSLNTYILHHKQPIKKGGGVYDLDNLIIVSPRMHQEILDRSYHFGEKRFKFKKPL